MAGVHRLDEVVRGPIKSKTVFPALILHLIEQQPDHGYGLMQRIAEICGDLVAVNTNKIYPLLRRLEERGFVTASWEHPTKRSRRVYAITADGQERLGRIKRSMLPYLDSIAGAIERLRAELYETGRTQKASRR
jgi:PadR family transcriptional regulator, regulatory protein PadR